MKSGTIFTVHLRWANGDVKEATEWMNIGNRQFLTGEKSKLLIIFGQVFDGSETV